MVNKAKCLNCGDIIESKHVHDFVTCSCYNNYETNGGHGIFIDGGDEYYRCGGNIDDIEYVSEEGDPNCDFSGLSWCKE